MFRHLLKAGLTVTSQRNLKYGNQLVVLSRHFSNELTAEWPQAIKSFLENEKITKPTLIQEKTLPVALENQDIVGIARTGSGKTLAFVLPAVMKILAEREKDANVKRPSCLVLAPTRELATQTADVFRKFAGMKISSIALVGGSSRAIQLNDLENRDHDVYIATPGRLLDLVQDKCVDLSHIKYLVLDEADRMLDMGFEPQIRSILSNLPSDRQTMMWSATWPPEIQGLAAEFMRDYKQIKVDSEKLKANPNIKQMFEVCAPFEKMQTLVKYLDQFKKDLGDPRVLIFVNTKVLADRLLVQLMRHRHRAISMHGNRSQRQRDDALRLFKNRLCNIMIATDVAARGLDIDDITHVVNYDFPNTIEDYIHRIGRTARHEKSGASLSLFTDQDIRLVDKVIAILKETKQEIPDQLIELSKQNREYAMDYVKNTRRGRRDDFYSSGGQRHYRQYNQGNQRRPLDNLFSAEDEDDEEYEIPRNARSERRSLAREALGDRSRN